MAVSSDVDICNMALDHLGKPSITALDEGSNEAQACVRQYDIARRIALSKSPWIAARKLRSLSLLVDNELSDTWEYHYDLPNDLLKMHRLIEPGRQVMANSAPEPMYLEQGTVYTNMPSAMALYITDSTDTQKWTALFDDVVALTLALRLAPGMTRRSSDVDKLRQAYRDALNEAIEHDAAQETGVYTFTDGGYTDARDTGGVYEGRQADGSTIWG